MATRRTRSVSRAATIEAWLVVMALALTAWLIQSGTLAKAMAATSELGPLPASLVAGAAYSTFVTTPLAIGGFLTIGDVPSVPVWQIALIGAFGATLVDLLLIRGVRSPLAMLIVQAFAGFKMSSFKRYIMRWPALKWVAAAVGGFLVAIPLPTDELGIVVFGASGLRAIQMVPVIFVADFVGVYAIVSAAQYIG